MENSPLLKIAEQDLHRLGLLQQAIHHLFPRVLLQLSTQTSSTSSAILGGVNCCLLQITLSFVQETKEVLRTLFNVEKGG
ncbi:hypothetical protein LOK49_LG11G02050 [Camellia lanceoleosa]|uniref:Uncharacterized protein n=1 Tax=Camellia lanceoleosa TaxID=1840588 RepID=A0ACC0G6S2_9ERIC|nr:hypothetical protein LOK49_LG11G02050 [Camellia lanceoleosa]